MKPRDSKTLRMSVFAHSNLHRPRKRELVLTVCLLWGCLAAVPSLVAQTTWTGGIGDWTNGTNWSAGVPNFVTNAFVDGIFGTNSTVNVNTIAAVNNLTVDLGDTVNLNNHHRLGIHGSLLNNGTVRVGLAGAGFGPGTYLMPVGTTTFAGNGTVEMTHANAGLIDASDSNGASDHLINSATHTIRGLGDIGAPLTLQITNHGLIEANVSGGMLNVTPNEMGMINTGTLRASNGGTMSLQGNGVFTNTGGLIEAAANSTVFHRTTNKGVLGGQLTGAGTHLVDVANLARFDSLAVNAYVEVRGGSRLAALGTITNNNLIRLNDSGVLEPVGTTTFAGNGTVEMTHANSGLYDASDSNGASDHLINGSTHKIRGLGRIGVFDTLQITNHGLIESNVSGGTLELQPDLSGLTNTGLLLATNGGTMNVSANGSGVINTGIVRATNGGTFTVNRTITSDGTIDAGAGSNVFGTFITNNRVIKGSGLLDLSHTLTNNGLISAGDSTGTLRINADAVVLHSTSQMLIEIAGTGAGQFDLLDFNFDTVGKLFLNGSLSVDLNGYLPSASDTFVVLTADNNNNLDGSDLQGTFSNVANGGTLTTLGGEGHFTVSYSDNSVLLSNFVSIQATIVDSFVNHVGYSGSGSSIDAGKVLAKEGVTPTLLTYDNLINTTRGINGVVFDFNNLPGSPTAADFVFQVSLTGAFDLGTNPVGSWTGAPAPSSVSVAPGSPDRVSIVWPDSAIANRWLRITVLANGNTGLSEPEVYYIGHLLGETTGPSGPVFTVSFADITPIRSTVGSSVDASSPVDIDKNGTVAFADISAMRASVGNQLTIITIPAAGGGG